MIQPPDVIFLKTIKIPTDNGYSSKLRKIEVLHNLYRSLHTISELSEAIMSRAYIQNRKQRDRQEVNNEFCWETY
jgi:hypothetical protein